MKSRTFGMFVLCGAILGCVALAPAPVNARISSVRADQEASTLESAAALKLSADTEALLEENRVLTILLEVTHEKIARATLLAPSMNNSTCDAIYIVDRELCNAEHDLAITTCRQTWGTNTTGNPGLVACIAAANHAQLVCLQQADQDYLDCLGQ